MTVSALLPPVEPGAFARLLDAERAGAVELSERVRGKALKASAADPMGRMMTWLLAVRGAGPWVRTARARHGATTTALPAPGR